MDPNQNSVEPNPTPAPQPIQPSMPSPSTPAQPVLPSQPAIPPAPPKPFSPIAPQPAVSTPLPEPKPTQIVVGGESPQTIQPTAPVAQNSSNPAVPKPGKSKKKIFLILLGIIIVLGAGSAAAYFGYIVPNKPENVLKTAVINSIQSPQTSFAGNLEGSSTTTEAGSFKATFSGAEDLINKAMQGTIDLTVMGISVKAEARYVDKNIYFRVGDLTSVVETLNALDLNTGKMAKSINDEIANKWIVIDSTLLKSKTTDCIMNASWSLTKADIELLEQRYSKNPFTTIQSTSKESLDGKSTTKMMLSIDDDKLSAYGYSLDEISVIKNLAKCDKSFANYSSKKSNNSLADHDKTPLTVWIDNSSKKIVKLEAKSTAKDAKQGVSGVITANIKYDPVKIEKPNNAIPAIQVISKLQQSLGTSAPDLTQLLSGA